MSEFEVPFKLQNSKYNEILLLEKRGDEYGIVMAQEGQDGNVYKRWMYPQRREKDANGKMKNVPAETGLPWRIPLGSRTEALALLQNMAIALGAKPAHHAGVEKAKHDDDIPF